MERFTATKKVIRKKKQSQKNLGRLSDRICNPATAWFESQLVCEILNISMSTLCRYRHKKILPFMQVRRKFYYKVFDGFGEPFIAPSEGKEKRS